MPASPFSAYYANDVTDLAATLLNDPSKTIWTASKIRPMLAVAWRELGEELRIINDALLKVYVDVTYAISATPGLLTTLSDVIMPLKCEERGNVNEPFVPMKEVDWELPNDTTSTLRFWAWRLGQIYVPPCSATRLVRIHYLKIQYDITSDLDEIVPNNALNFLAQRTAALSARLLGENPTRADELDIMASQSLARITQQSVKSQQGVGVRRRPLRAAFARRRYHY